MEIFKSFLNKPKNLSEILNDNLNIVKTINETQTIIKFNDYIVNIGQDYLGRGLQKTAKKVSVKNKDGSKFNAALIYANYDIGNKRIIDIGENLISSQDKITNNIKIIKKAETTGITPKLFSSFVNENGYVLLMELIEGHNLCKKKLNDKHQLLLLKSYTELGKLGLIQNDVNCANIIFTNENTLKIIDDISQIDPVYLTTKELQLYYILNAIKELQRIGEETNIYKRIMTWLYNNKNVTNSLDENDNIFDDIREQNYIVDTEFDKEFNIIVNDFLQRKGGKNKFRKTNKKNRRCNKTKKINDNRKLR
jgi:RIO-like serine/threonine protein kinase